MSRILTACAIAVALGVAALNFLGWRNAEEETDRTKKIENIVTTLDNTADENHELLVLVRCAFEPVLRGVDSRENSDLAIQSILNCLEREDIDLSRITAGAGDRGKEK